MSISGAMSFENLYLVNGAVVNENLLGQSLPLYVEDAIQEITTSSSAISAEYGHFNGGIVNVVTKSGGNDPSGSLRTTFTNDSWRATTPFGEPKVDQTVPSYEATFGGPIQPSKIWFFLAGRYNDTAAARQTGFTDIEYEAGSRDSRFEGKVTYTPLPAHTVRASYFTLDNQRTNVTPSGGVLDLASLMDTGDKQDLFAAHYTGALSSRMFVEGQFSQRRRRVRFGSTDTDLITGTLVIDQLRNGALFGAPFWCAVCTDDSQRDNQSILIKGNYFLSSERLGSHDLIAGYNTYNDRYVEDNHQSGSSFGFAATSLIRDQSVFPVYRPFQTVLLHRPVTAPTLGSDFRVHSFFINDRAQVNRYLSLNLGLRHDRNHARDSIRRLVSNDSKWSPRLSLTYSPDGTGRWGLTTGFARYVSRVNTNFGNEASPGGRFSSFVWFYLGPTVNGDPNAPTDSLVSTRDANQIALDWFFANGGTARPPIVASVPGVDAAVDDNLRSPYTDEWTAGVRRTLGTRGEVRVDLIRRRYRDFYAERVDTSTGQVTDENGRVFDLHLFGNTDDATRDYAALSTQFSYFLTNRIALGGHWTISRTKGDLDGEAPNAIFGSGVDAYPEYRGLGWARGVVGDLENDQRHLVRVWGTYAMPLSDSAGSLTVGVIQSYDSGRPYGANGPVNPFPFVQNPGYATPPRGTGYWFTGRDAFRTEGAASTDLSVTYAFGLGSSAELFAQAQGRFKRSSQHLNGEELRWEHRNVVGHPVRDVFRCGRRVVPRRDAVSIGVGSGRRSPAGCPAKRRRWGPACPSRSERDGSAKVEACRRSAWPLCRGATCRLPSEKRSPSCTPSTAGFVISLGESAGPRRPSLGSSVAMRQPAVADSSIARRPRSGTPT